MINDIHDHFINDYPKKRNCFKALDGWMNAIAYHENITNHEFGSDERLFKLERLSEGFKDYTILELGPWEGVHSFMLEKMGAKEIVSIEGSSRNFLKCLITKEFFQLNNVKFLLGDFAQYLEQNQEKFDFILAMGVLYHTQDPYAILNNIAKKCNEIGIWTHYFDVNYPKSILNFTGRTKEVNYEGFEPFKLFEQIYDDEAVENKNYFGGMNHNSWWPLKDDLSRFLKYRGFKVVEVEKNDIKDVGPGVLLYAKSEG